MGNLSGVRSAFEEPEEEDDVGRNEFTGDGMGKGWLE
jgi:hypothetical protein